jgi:glutathione S-transferase
MKLYYAPGACSLSPHIVAREAGIALELEKVDLAEKRTAANEDFRSINPKGYVPAMRLDDGTVLTEGPAIVQYLVDLRPDSGLAGDRYRLAEWLAFLNSEVHKVWSDLWHPKGERAPIVEKLQPRLAFLEAHLKEQPFLMGSRFSAADAYLFTLLSWAQPTKVDLSRFRALTQYAERVRQRPRVQEALRAEGLVH